MQVIKLKGMMYNMPNIDKTMRALNPKDISSYSMKTKDLYRHQLFTASLNGKWGTGKKADEYPMNMKSMAKQSKLNRLTVAKRIYRNE